MAPGDKGRWGEEGAPSPPVVIVHPYDPSRPAEGGDIRYTIDFLRFYRRHGVSVTVVGILRPGAVPPADGGFMPIHHAYEWLAFGLKLLARLPFLPLPPNAVIQTHQPLFMFPVVLVDWRRPKVCTLGAVRLHMARRRWPRWYPLIALVYGWLERLMIRRVDRFVAVSPYIAGEYLRRYP
jgi:hypothetical protein